MEDKIRRSASLLYRKKVEGKKCAVTERCIDFRKLEELCRRYRPGLSTEKTSQDGMSPASVREDSCPPVHGKRNNGCDQLCCPEGVPYAGRAHQPAQNESSRKDDHNVAAKGDDEGGEPLSYTL